LELRSSAFTAEAFQVKHPGVGIISPNLPRSTTKSAMTYRLARTKVSV
jgi:hypothetical protein